MQVALDYILTLYLFKNDKKKIKNYFIYLRIVLVNVISENTIFSMSLSPNSERVIKKHDYN